MKACEKHKETKDYNCSNCINETMAGMEKVNRKYEPKFSNPEFPNEV